MADSCSSVLGLFEFGYPVIDRGVELGESFFLLEDGLVREASYARGAQVRADSVVEVAAAGAQGAMRFAEVFAAFIEAAEFLFLLVGC